MYVYNKIHFVLSFIHSVEYYFQWQLCHYSDSLDAGPYVVCFLTETRDLLSIQNIRPALRTSGLLFSGCCGVKQLMHESDHSPLFSAYISDQHSCNGPSCVCLQGIHRDIFTFYHSFGGMTSISVYVIPSGRNRGRY